MALKQECAHARKEKCNKNKEITYICTFGT